jgi:hypothetical protein
MQDEDEKKRLERITPMAHEVLTNNINALSLEITAGSALRLMAPLFQAPRPQNPT